MLHAHLRHQPYMPELSDISVSGILPTVIPSGDNGVIWRDGFPKRITCAHVKRTYTHACGRHPEAHHMRAMAITWNAPIAGVEGPQKRTYSACGDLRPKRTKERTYAPADIDQGDHRRGVTDEAHYGVLPEASLPVVGSALWRGILLGAKTHQRQTAA